MQKRKMVRDHALTSIDQLLPFFVKAASGWRLEYRGIAVSGGQIERVTATSAGNWEPQALGIPATVRNYVQITRKLTLDAEASARAYAHHVAATGEDPLKEFYVERTRTVEERWHADVRKCLMSDEHGLYVRSVWRGKGRHIQPGSAPRYVADFLELKARPTASGPVYHCGVRDINDVVNCEVRPVAPTEWIVSFTIAIKQPRPPSELRRELKAAARKRLAQR